MYDVDMNKIENSLRKLALDGSIFEADSDVDDRVLNSFKEVIMEIQVDTQAKPKKRNLALVISLVSVAAVAALVVGVLAVTGVFAPGDTTAAFVAIDINPGIILEIDKEESVKSIAFANADAAQLLKGVDLTGSSSLSAIGTIVALAEREGYLAENSDNFVSVKRFSDEKDKTEYLETAASKIIETLGFDCEIEMDFGSLAEGKAYLKLRGEAPLDTETTDTLDITTEPSVEPSVEPTLMPLMPEADEAGTGDVIFDIYDSEAVADVTNDGTDDIISFTAAEDSSTLTVNGTDYTIDLPSLAQKFAVTDVDISDDWIEIAFCDEFHEPDFELDWPYTYYYWFDGTDFIKCGNFWDMGWDGDWRAEFDANDHMDGHGIIMSVERSQNFTDAWYMAHWILDGTDRQQKEELYIANLLYPTEDLVLKKSCLLLSKISLDYFEDSYNVMWDLACWPHADGRVINPGGTGDVVIIAQTGETLKVVKIYGKRWFKLETSDGYAGWIRVVDFEMSGYDDVMYYDAWDIFDNIVVAG